LGVDIFYCNSYEGKMFKENILENVIAVHLKLAHFARS